MTKQGESAELISLSRARQELDQLIEEARRANRRFVVEVQGKPMAVILGIEEWENIQETLAELNDPEYLDSIRGARREIERGDLVTLKELVSHIPLTNRGR